LITAGLCTIVASPCASAAVGSLVITDEPGLGDVLGLADAEGVGDAVGDEPGLAEADADGLALEWLAPDSARDPTAWPRPLDRVAALPLAEAFGLGDVLMLPEDVGFGEAFAFGDALGLEDAVVPGDGDPLGDALGDGTGAVIGSGTPGTDSSTWRNLSTADCSSGATCSALLCGIETVMSLEPSCTTEAPLKP
jgi:hypothetical protein